MLWRNGTVKRQNSPVFNPNHSTIVTMLQRVFYSGIYVGWETRLQPDTIVPCSVGTIAIVEGIRWGRRRGAQAATILSHRYHSHLRERCRRIAQVVCSGRMFVVSHLMNIKRIVVGLWPSVYTEQLEDGSGVSLIVVDLVTEMQRSLALLVIFVRMNHVVAWYHVHAMCKINWSIVSEALVCRAYHLICDAMYNCLQYELVRQDSINQNDFVVPPSIST